MILAVVYVFFLLSGLSSLIYQVIWTRLLVFVFGSTTFATSTVLAVFMGGLALGSYLAGRRADKSRNPLLIYGALEGLIGLWALAAPLLFSAAIPVYKIVFQSLHDQIILFGLVRFLVASCILLVPTTCMGATLPFLSCFVTRSLNCVAARVGSLYAINTLGAVLGALLAGFCLIPSLGINCTTFVAASINVFLAVAVFVLSGRKKEAIEKVQTDKAAEKMEDANAADSFRAAPDSATCARLPVTLAATMTAFAISGALAMIYEVAWTRSLLMVIGSTTYAFTVMLSTFLIGIFSGSIIFARFADRLKNPLAVFAAAELCLCFAGFLSLVLFNWLPDVNLAFSGRFGAGQFFAMAARFLSAGAIMLPISLCLGAIFPLVVKICARDMEKLGNSIGNLYAVNTCGAIIGAFAAGFLVIPALGSEQTLAFTSLANLVLGIVLLSISGSLRPAIKTLSLIFTGALVVYLSFKPLHIWDIASIVYAQSDRRQLLATLSNVKTRELPGAEKQVTLNGLKSIPRLAFYREGPCASVAITTLDTPAAGKITTLFTNGHADASDYTDMDNQAMLAVMPLLLKPRAQEVCVVGWGSGVTSGYSLRFPIKEMICAEIEPVVLETSRFFHAVNFSAESDRRAVIEPADGRNYLLGTSKKFDVIISEPSNPWQAGVCNLFTREYFDICARSLKKDGVFAMWSQVTEIPTENLVQVYAALSDVFSQVVVFDSGTGDTIAIAGNEPFKLNMVELQATLRRPELKPVLARFKLNSAEDLLARMRICPSGLKKSVLGSKLNTDDMNYLEYAVAKSYESRVFIDENDSWFLQSAGPLWDYVDWGPASGLEKANSMLLSARACAARSPERALVWLERSMKEKPNADALSLQAEIKILLHDYRGAAACLQEGEGLFPNDGRFSGLSGIIALKCGDYQTARRLLEKSLQIDRSNSTFSYYLALTYSVLDLGKLDGLYQSPPSPSAERVIALCRAAESEKFISVHPDLLLMLAGAYRDTGRFPEAVSALKRFLPGREDSFLAWKLLGETYSDMKDFKQSAYCFSRQAKIAAAKIPTLLLQAGSERSKNNHSAALRLLQLSLQLDPSSREALSFLKDYAGSNKQAADMLAALNRAKP